eukprot:387695-Rhodomonas_salina.1
MCECLCFSRSVYVCVTCLCLCLCLCRCVRAVQVCSLIQYDEEGNVEPGTNIPMVDGGTEGMAGHVNVIYPGRT